MTEINIRDKRFSSIEARLEKMSKRANEFCQTRSNHQIEKFICEDEYTPITKFRHVAHNSYVAMQEIRRMVIERERILREIDAKQTIYEEYQNNPNVKPFKEGERIEDYDLDIYEKSRQLDDLEIRIKGLSQEVDYMETICDKLEEENGKPFTAEQYQEEEPIYWQKRFATQMHQSQIGQQLGIGEGNYRSYLQSIAKPVLDDGQQMQAFPLTPDAIATVALSGRPGIEEVMLRKIEASDTPELKS